MPVPTGTNRSIGLIALQTTDVRRRTADEETRRTQRQAPHEDPLLIRPPVSVLWLLLGLVVMARGKTPDPIPNSAVKTLSADGTAA